MAKVHEPPNTMVIPKVCEEDLYSVLVLEDKSRILCRKNERGLSTGHMNRVIPESVVKTHRKFDFPLI
jgi:hypothetical protein